MKGSLGRIRTAPISSRTRATVGPEGPAEPGVVMVVLSPTRWIGSSGSTGVHAIVNLSWRLAARMDWVNQGSEFNGVGTAFPRAPHAVRQEGQCDRGSGRRPRRRRAAAPAAVPRAGDRRRRHPRHPAGHGAGGPGAPHQPADHRPVRHDRRHLDRRPDRAGAGLSRRGRPAAPHRARRHPALCRARASACSRARSGTRSARSAT